MTRLALILAIVLTVGIGAGIAARETYLAGFHEAERLAAIEEEQSRKSAQATINEIEKSAAIEAAKVAERDTAAKVEKVIADVRKTNPACSLVVPSGVRDALKRR
jgi:hypothetical protein